MGSLAGQTAKFTVSHAGSETELAVKIGSRSVTGYKLVDAGNLTEMQKRIRDGWLKK